MKTTTKASRPRPTTMEEYEGSKKRARGEGGKARKACPQGNRCPYQDEYQHNLEFSHDHNPKDPPNQRFGAKENIKIQGDNSMAFAGNGLRLGTGTGGNRLLETFEQQLQEKQHNQPLPPKKDDIPSTGVHSAPGTIRCNLCGLSLPREDAKDHFLLHQLTAKESTRNPASSSSSSNPYRNLTSSDPIMIDITPDKTRQLRHDRQEQDVEYDESVLEEIRKKSEEEELEKMRLLKETQAKEREAYNIAKKESKRLLEIEEQRRAIMKLLPEPNLSTYAGNIVAIRFRLPSGAKLVRKFRVNNSMQDAFDYLKTLPELVHSKYMLQSVVGAITFKAPILKTFKDNGIVGNTSLIVVFLDDENDEEGDMMPLSQGMSGIELSIPTSKPSNKKRDREDDDEEEIVMVESKKVKASRPTTSTDVIDLT